MHDLPAPVESTDKAGRVTGTELQLRKENGPERPELGGLSARVPTISEFQSDAIEIEERPPPRFARITLYVIAALIVAATTWASFATLDRVVTAKGKLLTTQPNLVVQPLETSVIREIHVAVGNEVNQGQALATLDPTFPQADMDQMKTRLAAFSAAADRLEAELHDRDFTAADSTNPDEVLQQKLFAQRKAFYQATLQDFDAQIASARANLQASHGEERISTERLSTLGAIEAMRSTLMDKELGSRLNFLLSRDARLEVENDLERTRGSEIDLTHRLEKTQADRQSFIEDFRRTAFQEFVDTLAKRNDAAEDLKKAELRRQMIVLRAPADSVVLEVAHVSVGSVVREAETIFVLAPRNSPLEAEVNVETKDIADIAVGQLVRLKFDPFPFQKFGTGSGRVRVISKDTFSPEPEKGGAAHPSPPFYRVRIDMTNVRLRGKPDQIRMIPGMTLTAEMNVGNRTVISYFLYPLLRGLDESIREP
jgi:hemolysin D